MKNRLKEIVEIVRKLERMNFSSQLLRVCLGHRIFDVLISVNNFLTWFENI